MYRVVVSLEVKNGLKREYEVGAFDDLKTARDNLDAWLKPYKLHCYQFDDLFLSITGFYTCYVRGNEAYHAIAFIHVEGD